MMVIDSDFLDVYRPNGFSGGGSYLMSVAAQMTMSAKQLRGHNIHMNSNIQFLA